jgi:hypothetical protein
MAPATELGLDVPDTRNVSMTTPPQRFYEPAQHLTRIQLDTTKR